MSAIELATEVAEAALSSLEDTGAGSIAPQPDADADVHVQLAAVKKELQAARAEIVALQTENARLRESAAASKSSSAETRLAPPCGWALVLRRSLCAMVGDACTGTSTTVA